MCNMYNNKILTHSAPQCLRVFHDFSIFLFLFFFFFLKMVKGETEGSEDI